VGLDFWFRFSGLGLVLGLWQRPCTNPSILLQPLGWKCDSPWMGCAWRITPIHSYMWCEQAMIEWSRRVTSVVACCYSY